MVPYNPYTNSKGFFNPRVMTVRSEAPSIPGQQVGASQVGVSQVGTSQVSAPQVNALQAGVPQTNHPRRSKPIHILPGPTRGSSGEKHHVEMAPGDASVPCLPARKKSRLEELDAANKEAGSPGITDVFRRRTNIQNVPSWVLMKVLQWQVKGESTAVTVAEIDNLVLVSKEFRIFFYPELVKEGIRHAARTKNHDLLKYLCPKVQTLNFPAWDFGKGRNTCKTRNASLPPVGAPLHESTGANDAIGVAFLLAAGAAPNFLDCRHETALHRAAKSAGSVVFGQLMKAGGDSGIRNLHLWNPFDIAIASKNLAVIYSLWRLGQRIDGHKDPTGSSPVHKAIDAGCLSTLDLVFSFKPKLNARDWSGATPLIYAIREGKNPDILQMIMKHSPNALAKDRAGKTALYYAHVCKNLAAWNLFARYYCGPAFNKGLRDAQKKCYRRYETTPREFSFIYHY
ncbi:ankyrin [Tuber magnatum]|uniref:Ankyrin n=1 Tax=Tuber magnatum TaxID=42249 RepID=A0A317SJB4_9PEZI|nr:ankyrin [Tuber magnatum]